VIASLLFEFGRPQDIVPGLKFIPFSTLLDVLILVSVISAGKLKLLNLQTKLWLPLFGVMAIHVPIAMNNFWALMTLKDMLLLFSLYLGIVAFVNSTERMTTLLKVFVGVHIISAVLGIMHKGTGVGGWMGDENDFCMAMNMIVPFAYFFLFASSGAKKMMFLGALGLFLLAAMTTLSRGGFFGLAAAGVYCWYRSPKKLNALIVVVIAVMFMVLVAPSEYWDEIASSTDDKTMDKGTGGERLYTWGIGFEMFLSNPIIGIGQSNFPWTFDVYQAGRTFNGKSIAGRQAHSLYFTLLPELGLVGIFIIGGMTLKCFMDLRQVRKQLAVVDQAPGRRETSRVGEDIRVYFARAMEGSFIAYFVSGVFISILWYPSLWVMLGFAVALRNTLTDEELKRGIAIRGRMTRGLYRAPRLESTRGLQGAG
jgi:hypothetical protein